MVSKPSKPINLGFPKWLPQVGIDSSTKRYPRLPAPRHKPTPLSLLDAGADSTLRASAAALMNADYSCRTAPCQLPDSGDRPGGVFILGPLRHPGTVDLASGPDIEAGQ